ncbi:MAG: ABC transporter ATP-binding protein [Acidimicrobiales bacterium]|nr:ABC transporter ATP-binding protein [Acidimicrobiales bacterium]
MGDAVVRVTGVSKRYGRHLAPVLHDVSFSGPPSSIITLAGSNGSGKSTLLRCIAGLARHTGSIEICGEPIDRHARTRRLFGYLPQVMALPPHMTIAEALYFFAALRGADPTELPLPDDFLREGDTRVGTLSGGQRQRVAIAVALLGSPPLLLLDEPVANLDEDGRAAFWGVLGTLRDQGTTALIASPSPSDLAGVGDAVVVLRNGRIVASSLTEGRDDEQEATA